MKNLQNMIRAALLSASFLFIASGLEIRGEARNVQFWTLSWHETIEDVYFQPSESERVESISANRRFVNGPYRYTGEGPIVFFEQEINAEGVETRRPMASYPLSTGSDSVLLLFRQRSSTNGGSLGYSVLGIDFDETRFRPGGYRFLNVTQGDVAVQLGDAQLLIPSRADETLYPEVGHRERFTARMASSGEESGWALIFSSEWTHRENRRVLAIFFTDEQNRVQLKTVGF